MQKVEHIANRVQKNIIRQGPIQLKKDNILSSQARGKDISTPSANTPAHQFFK